MNTKELSELKDRYQKLSQADFDKLNQWDLTEVELIVYNEEQSRRYGTEWKKIARKREIAERARMFTQDIFKNARMAAENGKHHAAIRLFSKIDVSKLGPSESEMMTLVLKRIEKKLSRSKAIMSGLFGLLVISVLGIYGAGPNYIAAGFWGVVGFVAFIKLFTQISMVRDLDNIAAKNPGLGIKEKPKMTSAATNQEKKEHAFEAKSGVGSTNESATVDMKAIDSNIQSENKKTDTNNDEKTGTAMIWGLMIGCCLLILWVVDGMSKYESDLSKIMGIAAIAGAAYVIKLCFEILRR